MVPWINHYQSKMLICFIVTKIGPVLLGPLLRDTYVIFYGSNSLQVKILASCIIPLNHSKWKSYAVAKLNWDLLGNIHGWTVVFMAKTYCTGYKSRKISWL